MKCISWCISTFLYFFMATNVFSEGLALQNSGTKPDQAEQIVTLGDIQGPVPLPQPTDWLLILSITAILALIIFGWWRTRINKKPTPLSPKKKALKKINKIVDLYEAPFLYTEKLSLITREYIEERFDLSCKDRTTGEFLQQVQQKQKELKRNGFDLGEAQEFFTFFDSAKFAKKTPSSKELQEHTRRIQKFIERTGEDDEIC